MDKLPRVGKKWNKKIKKWLRYKKDVKIEDCPFNLNSFWNINSCLKTYCGVFFPRTRKALEERKNLLRPDWDTIKCCPCEVYTITYINRVAHRYLKESKNANTRGK